MNIISFAWTTPAIYAKHKTCTRREWNDDYARRFKANQLLAGYDRSPRFGGKQIATIRLIMEPYKESYCQAPSSDWENEGFAYLESIGVEINGLTPGQLWFQWLNYPPHVKCWVVRFYIESVIND